MNRKLKTILFLLSIIVSCENLKKDNADLAFLTYLSRLTGTSSSSTAVPKILSTDFASSDSTSPVAISKAQTLGITFDIGMNPDGCQITLDGTQIASSVTASSDSLTLSFKPSTNWSVDIQNGFTINLTSNCKSSNGVSYTPGSGFKVYIADTVVYVDGTAGNDSNPGTMANPLLTITSGINTASSSCSGALICLVLVKGASYTTNATIFIPTNISIFGGFDPSDWKKRRADKTTLSPYDTILTDNSTGVTGTGTDPYSSIKYFNYTGTKEKSILDGIIVNGPVSANAGNYVSPIGVTNLQSGAGVTIRNTITNDRSSTLSVTSAGFVSTNNAGTILLTNNKFIASSITAGSSTRYGVVYNGSASTSTITITGNDIDAGVSTTSTSGFFSTGTMNGIIDINKNTITARDCSGCDSIGITASFATANGMSVSQNTITSGAGTLSLGISFISGSGLSISNNTINSGTATSSSIGIAASTPATSITISNNQITAGNGTGTNGSNGLFLNSAGTHTISGNTIISGTCGAASCVTSGILHATTAATLVISNNTIASGNCSATSCSSIGFTTTGAAGSTFTISNNIVNSGNALATSAGMAFASNSSTIVIDSNTVLTGTCSGANCNNIGINHAFGQFYTTTNNTITAGVCTGTTCNQIAYRQAANASSLTITGNTFNSGASSVNTNSRIALDLSQWPANSSIQRNTFLNQSASGIPISVIMAASTNSLKFCSNVLVGGGRTDAGNTSTLEIALVTGGIKFYGNTIIGASVTAGVAIPVNFSTAGIHTNLSLDQNIIAGSPISSASTTCVREGGAVIYSSLTLNNFSDCSGTLYNENGTILNTYCAGNFGQVGCGTLLVNPTGTSNTILSPVFRNFTGNDFHLDPSTPTAISQGLVELTAPNDFLTQFNSACGNSLDRDGNTRTANSSIGAYR